LYTDGEGKEFAVARVSGWLVVVVPHCPGARLVMQLPASVVRRLLRVRGAFNPDSFSICT